MTFVLGPAARAAGHALAAYDTIGSTNAEGLILAREGCGPTWIAARAQTAGRGRRGRAWETGRGNLAASFATVLPTSEATAATLGFVAGLALDAALRAAVPSLSARGARPELKWPNDVIVDGAKLAGILLEAERLSAKQLVIVVGIGVNVVSAPDGLPYPATSLHARGDAVEAEDIFRGLSDAFVGWLDAWDEGRGLPAVRKAWLARAAGLGGPVAVDLSGRRIAGVFETMDDAGRLVIRTPDGASAAIAAGEVHFGAARSVPL